MSFKSKLNGLKSEDSLARYWLYTFIVTLYRRPAFGIVHFILNLLYSYRVSFKLFGFSYLPKTCFSGRLFRVIIECHPKSLVISGKGINIIFNAWGIGGRTEIKLSNQSVFKVLACFNIGDGCKFIIGPKATLILHGKSVEQISGITCNSVILCSKYIEIGQGSILSWGCYLTDSTQHKISGSVRVAPVHIGASVWLSEGVTCAPGTIIGDGCIVGAKSYVNRCFDSFKLIAGSPAKVVKSGVQWSR